MNFCNVCGKKCSGKKCMACYKKGFEFIVADFIFKNKKDLNITIKQKIKESPRNIEFTDRFFLTIINELHEDVKKRNLKVTKLKILDWTGQTGKWEFCRERFRGGIFVIGFFEPINEWHGVTLYPHRRSKNPKQNLILALRQKWSESIKARTANVRCEKCNAINPQLHHDSNSFREIAEQSYNLFSTKEKENGVGDDWWLHEQEADALPNDHPAVIHMLKLHNNVKYRWLCLYCHMEEHSNKKGDKYGNS